MLLIHVIQIVKTTKVILIMSYWKPLLSLSPLDVGKPAVRPHKFSIYIREAASEKLNDLYVFLGFFFPLEVQCSKRNAGWTGDRIYKVHAIKLGKNNRDYLCLQCLS